MCRISIYNRPLPTLSVPLSVPSSILSFWSLTNSPHHSFHLDIFWSHFKVASEYKTATGNIISCLLTQIASDLQKHTFWKNVHLSKGRPWFWLGDCPTWPVFAKSIIMDSAGKTMWSKYVFICSTGFRKFSLLMTSEQQVGYFVWVKVYTPTAS